MTRRAIKGASRRLLAAVMSVVLTVGLAPGLASAGEAHGTNQMNAQGDGGLATQGMHRLYNPNSGEHFYTADVAERDKLTTLGWRYEGIGWTAPATSNTPVYRLYNKNGGEHHYTFDEAEKDMLVEAGWTYEGIGWYSDDAESVPLFREYNPNAFANNHNYTTDPEEHAFLLSIGWNDEGEAWYGIDPSEQPEDPSEQPDSPGPQPDGPDPQPAKPGGPGDADVDEEALFARAQDVRDAIFDYADEVAKNAGEDATAEEKVDALVGNMVTLDEYLNGLLKAGDIVDYEPDGSGFYVKLPFGSLILDFDSGLEEHQGLQGSASDAAGVDATPLQQAALDLEAGTPMRASAGESALGGLGIQKAAGNCYGYEGHVYRVFDVSKAWSWEGAQRFCEGYGGHLASISDAAENEAVYAIMRASGYDSAYIGLHLASDGSWQWVDGTPVSYLNWGEGEPSNSDNDELYGMYYYEKAAGTWNDARWVDEFCEPGFICEWDSQEACALDQAAYRIATIEPNKSQFNTTVFTKAAKSIEDNVDGAVYAAAVADDEVTVGWLLDNLSNYNVVIWNGHGGHLDSLHSFLWLSEQASEQKDAAYKDMIGEGSLVWCKSESDGKTTRCYVVTPEFVARHYKPSQTGRNIVYACCCTTAYDKTHGDANTLADAFLRSSGSGADVFFGYDYAVSSGYNESLSDYFWYYMVNGYSATRAITTAKSMANAKDYNKSAFVIGTYIGEMTFLTGKSSLDKYNKHAAELHMFGNGDVTLYKSIG